MAHLVRWGESALDLPGYQQDQLGLWYLIGGVLTVTLLVGVGLGWRLHSWWVSWKGFTFLAQLGRR